MLRPMTDQRIKLGVIQAEAQVLAATITASKGQHHDLNLTGADEGLFAKWLRHCDELWGHPSREKQSKQGPGGESSPVRIDPQGVGGIHTPPDPTAAHFERRTGESS